MDSTLHQIGEEFSESIDAIRKLSDLLKDKEALIQSTGAAGVILILASVFEKFVRDVLRETARIIIEQAKNGKSIPPKLELFLWKQTVDDLLKRKRGIQQNKAKFLLLAKKRIESLFNVLDGEYGGQIDYEVLNNQNNMRPSEIKNLFKNCGVDDILFLASCQLNSPESEQGSNEDMKRHISEQIDRFYEVRNETAHKLDFKRSVGFADIETYLGCFEKFGKALCKALHVKLIPT